MPTLPRGRLWRWKKGWQCVPLGPARPAPAPQSPLFPEGSTVKRQRFSSRWRSSSLEKEGVMARARRDEDPATPPTRAVPQDVRVQGEASGQRSGSQRQAGSQRVQQWLPPAVQKL